MPSPVVVYSPDDIRGQILSKTLEFNNIKSFRYVSHFETIEAVRRRSPSVIVIDAGKNSSDEINFIKELSLLLQGLTLIIICDQSEVSFLEGFELKNSKIVVDPIDPEMVLSLVRDSQSERFSIRNLRRMALVMISLYFRKMMLILFILFSGFSGGYVYWCISTLPKVDKLSGYASFESSRIYSLDNELLSEFYVERRNYIPYEKIPAHVRNAFIAAEDKRFFVHNGIDIVRIAGAFIADLRAGGFQQGGSTITQQLAKMIFLKSEKTITRKIQEIALSLQIERRYSKEQILEFYLNRAYFGSRAYGIEAASLTYFDKSTGQISISDAALLAGMIKAPSKEALLTDRRKSRERRDHILKEMLLSGSIGKEQYSEALVSEINAEFHSRKFNAPFFVDYCRGILEKKYGERLQTSGLKIYTTLDSRLQKIAEAAVQNGIDDVEKRADGDVQAALVAVELSTGHIKAMVGGADYWKSQFNRAVSAKRQPGSVFKPIVYLAALNRGHKPNDMIIDERIVSRPEEGHWTPKNYNGIYYGTVSLRTALSHSLNSATLNLAQKVGINNVIEEAENIGFENEIRPFRSSILGASESTLLELVYVYAALASGKKWSPICFDRVIDKNHIALNDLSGKFEKVIEDKILVQIRSMLRSVVLEGTAQKAKILGRDVYGKTGTTDDNVDAWFVGFDDNLAVGVWVGRDKRTPIGEGETGARAALPIWIEFMKNI
jgi:penicillin-binding protein 1A